MAKDDSNPSNSDEESEPLDRSLPSTAFPKFADPLATRSIDMPNGGEPDSFSVSGVDEPIKTAVGPYKLLEKLGEGGMGTVWMAEQEQPVRRRVALKVIKSDVGSKEILARFEAERQALAMMEHPNIARIVDAGNTADGQPFFAMELVRGLPLTEYCDRNRLSINERLGLFADVCHGVQHAHQKGIIHRDLKPGNILVGEVDGKPVPKVIDFGLAKALESTQRLTDQSLFTGIGQVLGTLKYMSPEQASLDTIDIDTRTDIYALGVILYELLTGSNPLDDESFRGQAVLKILEMVRDREPVKPSSRLSNNKATLSAITEQRCTDSGTLNRILKGDLDWIVMKALEKDRSRRYETASGLADDIRHYLNSEVVEARPPSKRYRFKKFARRNRTAVTVTAVVTIALLAGITSTSLALARAMRSERSANEARQAEASQAKAERLARLDAQDQTRAAEVARKDAEQAQQLAEAETWAKEAALESEKRERGYAEAIADFVEQDFLALTSIEGQSRFDDSSGYELSRNTTLRELLDRAANKLKQRRDLHPRTLAKLNWMIGVNYRGLGDYELAIGFLEPARNLYAELYGPDHKYALSANNSLAVAWVAAGEPDKAISLHEQTLELSRAKLGEHHELTLSSMNNLAFAYNEAGLLAKALPLYEQTLELRKVKLGKDHPDTLFSMSNLAVGYHVAGQMEKALPLYEQTMELMKQRLGNDDPDTLRSMGNLAQAYKAAGQLEKALPLFEQTLELRKEKLGDDHPDTLMSMHNLAGGYQDTGQLDKALPLSEQVLAMRKAKLGDDHPDTLSSMGSLAAVYYYGGQLDIAIPLLNEAVNLMKANLGNYHPTTLTYMNNLAMGYHKTGQKDKALPLYREILELRKKKLGNDHPDTLLSMNNLAGFYFDSGELDKALPIFEQTLELTKAKLGTDHPNTLSSMHNLAGGYKATGQLDKALRLYKEALRRRKAKLGHDHPTTLLTMHNFAGSYHDAGQLDKAMSLYEIVVKKKEALMGRRNSSTLGSIANLGAVYSEAGRFEEAIELLEEVAREIPRLPALKYARLSLRTAYLRAGRKKDFLEMLEQDLDEARETMAANSTELASMLAQAGLDLSSVEDFEFAERLLRECITIRAKELPDDWRTFNSQSLLGGALLGKAKTLNEPELDERQIQSKKLLAEAKPLLVDGFMGLKTHAQSIPTATRQKWQRNAVNRLIDYAEFTADAKMLEQWKAEKKALDNAADGS